MVILTCSAGGGLFVSHTQTDYSNIINLGRNEFKTNQGILLGILEPSNRYGFNQASYMSKCHMHVIIWMEFRGAPLLYEVVSASVLWLRPLLVSSLNFCSVSARFSNPAAHLVYVREYASFSVLFLTEEKETRFVKVATHTGGASHLLLVLERPKLSY